METGTVLLRRGWIVPAVLIIATVLGSTSPLRAAGVPQTWEQTTQQDFQVDTLSNVTAMASAGNIVLIKTAASADVDTVGSVTEVGVGGQRGRLNCYHCTQDRTLLEIEAYLDIATSTEMSFVVYESNTQTGTYAIVHSNVVVASGTGVGFHGSGDIAVTLTSNKYYLIGLYWYGSLEYYRGVGNAVSFGDHIGYRMEVGYPPASQIAADPTVSTNTYYLRLMTATNASYVSEGGVLSTAIAPRMVYTWGQLSYNISCPGVTKITVNVLDGDTGQTLLSDVSSGTDLDAQGVTNASLRLEADFLSGEPDKTPYLHEWQVAYVGPDTHYVNVNNPTPSAPYTNWADAATNIQDAINAAESNDLVLVADGVYDSGGTVAPGCVITNRVLIGKPITVMSVNGPEVTSIVGQGPLGDGAVRCVWITNGAVLAGFTLTNGYTRALDEENEDEEVGGGAWCMPGGLVSNCVIVSNSAFYIGAGVFRGTSVACDIVDNWSGRCGGGQVYGTARDCLIARNYAQTEGGGLWIGTAANCTIVSNTVDDCGAGAMDCDLTNCVIAYNSCSYGGAGVSGGALKNCFLYGNSCAGNGGGASDADMKNCTVIGNSAARGGGAYRGTLENCIVYYNTDKYSSHNYYDADVEFSCTTPAPNGAGNTTNPPGLLKLGSPYIVGSSPCVDRGYNEEWMGSAVDVDGETRIQNGIVDMGCDECNGTNLAGSLTVSILAPYTNAVVGAALIFQADIGGRAIGYRWQWGDGSSSSNALFASHAFSGAGVYPVILTASNTTDSASATVTVSVVDGYTNYVAQAGQSPGAPYVSWATAASNIQDAVNANTYVGGVVLVSNGVYSAGGAVVHGDLTNRVVVTKPLTVRGVAGPTSTHIVGQGPSGDTAVRCVYLGSRAHLEGFTVTNGHARSTGDKYEQQSGGGIYCEAGATVSGCTVIGNRTGTYGYGGGIFSGSAQSCLVTSNSARYGGGLYWATAENCTLSSNSASLSGGGAASCTLRNCTVVTNTALYGGGTSGGVVENCVVSRNLATGQGGGLYMGTVRNCLVSENTATLRGAGGYISGSGGYFQNCTFVENYAGTNAGGIYLTGGAGIDNCVVVSNSSGGADDNWYVFPGFTGGGISYSCTTPLPDGVGNTTNEPMFADPGSGDYSLQATSPCIDAGINQDWMRTANDLAENARLFNGAVDIGAYEFTILTRLSVYLQGAYDFAAHRMRTTLRDTGRLPLASPYAADVRTVKSIPTNMTDWILIQLLETNTYNSVAARSVFLHRGGSVFSDDGTIGVILDATPGESYYVAVKHRNHVSVMSANPVAFNSTNVVYTFRPSSDRYAGGTNSAVYLEFFTTDRWAMPAGDADGNGHVQWVDETVSTNQEGRAGYWCGDLNLDGIVSNDTAVLFPANLGRQTAMANGEVALYPSLRVSPPRKTLFSGDSLVFTAQGSTNTVTWFFTDEPSGCSNSWHSSSSTVYYAGSSNGCIDVIEAWDGGNRFGRAYINVISTNDAAQAGKAVIIAGRKSADDPLWDATDYLADSAYNTLLYRGYSKLNIQYLSPVVNQDVDGNGAMDDVDLEATAANTELTFTNWVGNANKLFVYLVDHGGDSSSNGYFVLNSGEKLWASDLDAWLDDLQAAYTTEVTVVIDCCYAESMLDELTNCPAPAKRIVIAAAGSDEPAYFVAGGLVSFSDAFFSGVMLGLDVADSYDMAADAMSSYQTSVYADTGGGTLADGLYLGASYVAGKDMPQIGTVCGDQLLMGETTVTLWADDIVSSYAIGRVWCIIIPPSHNPDPSIPVSDITEIDLAYSHENGRYEVDYGGFNEAGSYRVAYYARDVWGSVSMPLTRYVIQLGYDERIVLMNGCTTNSPLWSNINYVANYTYSMLLKRRFDNDDIYYLSADTNQDLDGDGTNDVDALPSLANFGYAVTNWAATAGAGGPADKLTVYLLGEGASNTLQVGAAEYLSDEVLDDYLDVYQPGHCLNVVMDFSGAGAFIARLATPSNRVCLASCEEDCPAGFAQNGTVSFSHFFMSYIAEGRNVGESFSNARKYIRRATKRVRQNALLDDNGDGVTNIKGEDGLVALTTYIGSAFMTGDDEVPVVGSPMTNQVLSGSNSLLLWVADITDADGISNVWCIVTPPDYDGSNDLDRVDMAWNGGPKRYEGLYTNFVKHGTWFLTFYAEDNNGDISTPVQTEIVKRQDPDPIHAVAPDGYEVDDTSTNASFYTRIQLHNFHTDADVDWVKFYGQTNYAMEVSAVQLSTNMDIVLDLYYQETNGSLTHLDKSDSLYPEDDEYLFIAAPTSGWYFIRVTQYGVANWTPGTYELSVYLPLGGASVFVMAVDALAADAMSAGPEIVLDGSNYTFDANNMTRFFCDDVAEEIISVSITNLPAGYWAVECTNLANQSQNPDNEDYGNPRNLDMVTESYRAALFQFVPLVTAQATIRDQWTGERLQNVSVKFTAQSERIAGLEYDRYPDDAVYASNWLTSVEGDFPTNVMLPNVDWNMTLSVAGYPDVVFTNIILTTNDGATIDLGIVYLAPNDTNANLIADDWEDTYFGVGSNVNASADADSDGLNNRDEYRLGTHPQGASSRLGFDLEPEILTNGVKITWPVVEHRSYQVKGGDSLISNTWTYSAGPWEATTGQTNMSHTVSTNAVKGYYRIQAVLP